MAKWLGGSVAKRMNSDAYHVIGKSLLVVGVLLVAVGCLVLMGPKVPWIGRLPGDILIRRDHFSFYFPLTTCLLASALLTFVFWIIGRFRP